MSALYFLWALVGLTLGCWIAFVFTSGWWMRLMFKVSWVMMAVLVAFPLYTERRSESAYLGQTAVVAFDDTGRVELAGEAVFCWNRCANVIMRTSFKSSVTPITENPKARHLTYEADVEIKDWDKYFGGTGIRPKNGAIPTLEENHQALERAVSYELAEFNEATSRDLARFYNPWDTKQQHDLEAMLRAYLEPRLATRGIRFVRLQSFSVE